jgi:outer membrane protein
MTSRKTLAIIVKAAVFQCSIVALSPSVAPAADLTTSPPSVPLVAVPNAPPPWFVRFGLLGVLDQSSSNLFAQPLVGAVVPGIGFVPTGGAGGQAPLIGRGATFSNILSVYVEAGYFFTPNWSLDISAGAPVWVRAKITGASTTLPAPDTVLSKLLLGSVPITAVYHFTQLGPFQPYVGGGLAPGFAFAVRDGFNTGGSIDPSLGIVLQGGFDYMFSQNWGAFIDVKKLFEQTKGNATGINLGPPLGTIPVASTIKTSFQPWLFATGVTYRF